MKNLLVLVLVLVSLINVGQVVPSHIKKEIAFTLEKDFLNFKDHDSITFELDTTWVPQINKQDSVWVTKFNELNLTLFHLENKEMDISVKISEKQYKRYGIFDDIKGKSYEDKRQGILTATKLEFEIKRLESSKDSLYVEIKKVKKELTEHKAYYVRIHDEIKTKLKTESYKVRYTYKLNGSYKKVIFFISNPDDYLYSKVYDWEFTY